MLTRRIGAIVVLGALAAPLFGAVHVAASGGAQAASVEAVCPPAAPGFARCLALRRTDIAARAALAMSPLTLPPGYGPADLQSAYGLPTGSAGSGLTVAVVDAGNLATAETDLGTYRSQYGLPECTKANGCFRQVNQSGDPDPNHYPSALPGWGEEIALDIEMVSATCPNCNILLVEANDATIASLGTGVNTAVSLGAVAVSNSYGASEQPGETGLDASYYNHPGVAITASSGDCGYNCAGPPYVQSVQYPAASPYVVAVGGTRLTRDLSARGWTESAWGAGAYGAGSGCSAYEPKPGWQNDAACAHRTQADVSAVADPSTGVAINYAGNWYVAGGTSAASPIVAAVFALAGGPAAGTYPASYLYGATTGLNDVIGGNNDVHWGTCPIAYPLLCNGVAGYDGPTGLGTPNGTAAFTVPAPPTGATYVPLTPARILDTRDGTGGLSTTPFTSNVARTFQVTGHGGVPSGATAVTGNLTVTQQTNPGYLYVGPAPTNYPTSSNLNFPMNDDRANAVTVALGAGGSLSVTYVGLFGGSTAHVIFDVTGYFVPDTSGATYVALTPARILDTRDGTGGLSGPFSSHVARTFQVTGHGGVPSNVTAVTGNLTATLQAYGYLFVGPIAMNDPTSSNLNFPAHEDRANAVTVALGAGGTLSITYVGLSSGSTAHVVFDVTGYFVPGVGGAKYVPLTPARILDTRYATGLSGAFTSNVARTFAVEGRRGVASTATAVTGNLTVTQQTNPGYLYVGPVAMNDPTSSNLNFPMGDDRANAVAVALGAGGTLSLTYVGLFGGSTAYVIFDVTGYFVP